MPAEGAKGPVNVSVGLLMIAMLYCILYMLYMFIDQNVCCISVGSNGPQKFCIEKVGKENWLPRSHTW